jgi:hypothetical protein
VLPGSLDFYEFPFTAHHDVHVDFGPHVLLVIEVKARLTIDHTYAHCSNTSLDWRMSELARLHHPVERVDDRHRRAGDRGSARSSVCDQYIAIELDRELAELEIVEHRADTASDQPLNLLSASTELRPLARRARPRCTREHRVLSGQPALAATALPAGNAVLDRRGTQDARSTENDQARSLGIGSNTALERDRSQLGYTAVNPLRFNCFH